MPRSSGRKRVSRRVKREEEKESASSAAIVSSSNTLSPSPIVRSVAIKTTDTDEEGSSTTQDITHNTFKGISRLDDDFLPPQNPTTRTSPSQISKVKEASCTTTSTSKNLLLLSPAFASSNRGGRGVRVGKQVSSRGRRSVSERAARAAAAVAVHSQSGRSTNEANVTRASSRSGTSIPMGIQSDRVNNPFLSASIDNATDVDPGFLHGPVGSFTDDSPPRERSSTPDNSFHAETRESPHRNIYSGFPAPYYAHNTNHAAYHDPRMMQPFMQYRPQHYAPELSSSRQQHPSHPYHYQTSYGYPAPSYPPYSSHYHPPIPTPFDQSQKQSQAADHNLSPSVSLVDWGSPPGISFSDSFEIPESHRKARKRTPRAFGEAKSGERDGSDSSVSTPDKKRSSKIRGNPFRSPINSKKDFTKSPLFQSSPNLSFSIEATPIGGTAVDYSPMGPSFTNFTDAFASGDDTFAANRLSLNRSSSSDEDQTFSFPNIPQRSEKSTFLMNDLSPFQKTTSTSIASPVRKMVPSIPSSSLEGVARSPMQSRSSSGKLGRKKVSPKIPQISREEPRASKVAISSSLRPMTIRASPVAPSSDVKPRNLWQQPTWPAMRVTLGAGTHASLSSQKRSLEDINSRMRASAVPTPTTRAPSTLRGPTYEQQQSMSFYHGHTPYIPHHMLNTPMRVPGELAPMSSMSIVPKRHSALEYPPPSSLTTPNVASSESARFPRSSGGKENSGNTSTKRASGQAKDGKCNCKKSKCLKLYCECFAAKLYCDGCNCLECNNLPQFESKRENAIKQTMSKNRTAFEPRIADEHNMGCKCRRSQCLKKYCECFQAGVLCSTRCKCSDCMNHANSQKLIDVRRQMKDKPGADFAIRVNHEMWKKGSSSQSRRVISHQSRVGAIGVPGQLGHHPHPSLAPAVVTQPKATPYARPQYQGQPTIGPIEHSPTHINPVTPGLPKVRPTTVLTNSPEEIKPIATTIPMAVPSGITLTQELPKRTSKEITPSVVKASRPKAVRSDFDPSSSRKKRKTGIREEEELFPFFGRDYPEQPKTTALAIFSFLSNEDTYNAALVCSTWNMLATDDELWKFEYSF